LKPYFLWTDQNPVIYPLAEPRSLFHRLPESVLPSLFPLKKSVSLNGAGNQIRKNFKFGSDKLCRPLPKNVCPSITALISEPEISMVRPSHKPPGGETRKLSGSGGKCMYLQAAPSQRPSIPWLGDVGLWLQAKNSKIKSIKNRFIAFCSFLGRTFPSCKLTPIPGLSSPILGGGACG